MLLIALRGRTRYGYLFLVMALWMGFWGKISIHLALKYPYTEPIGHFDASATAWDTVLWVAIIASAGVMLGGLFFAMLRKKYFRSTDLGEVMVPVWYPSARAWVWPVSLAIIVGFALINLIFGIQQIGLVPRTILPWPLNALIAWQVSIGNSLLLTALLWWEVILKKNISVSIYALLVEGFLSTTSLLSRGLYFFHTIPQFFSLYKNRRLLIGFSKVQISALMLAFVILMILAISSVTTFRNYLYPHLGGYTTADQIRLTRLEVIEGGIANVKKLIVQGEPQEKHLRELQAEKLELESKASSNENKNNAIANPFNEEKSNNAVPAAVATRDFLSEEETKVINEIYYQIYKGIFPKILSLVVDRWIGVEGVMAVSAYPEKSNKLLFDAITEKRGIGTTTKFQEIANSHYRWTDASVWQFASLPGAPAFFYFSGSLWVVMLGMTVFSLLLQLSEQFVFKLTSNPLLCSVFGLTLANTISQFGIAPRQDIPFYGMIFGFVILVWIMQSDKIAELYFKYVAHRGNQGSI